MNYHYYTISTEGSNITLITDIISDSPLSIVWKVSGHDLPPNAIVHNDTIDGVLHNTLFLFNLSLLNSGNYTITAVNEYGLSSAYLYINVRKGMSQLFMF